MKASLLQEQTLKLAMTQELRQAITMLQYNAQELTEFLYEQSLDNPLIELSSFEVSKRKTKSTSSTTENRMEVYSNNNVTIQEHLTNQLRYLKINEKEKRALTFIILNIDENGYLQETDEELARFLSISVTEVIRYVQMVQGLEPAGVGARNLQECLLLQLKRLQDGDPIAEVIVEHHFDCFAKKDWKQLGTALKCSTAELQAAVDVIISLQPRPGIPFSHEGPMYIVPDLIVTKEQGKLVIKLNQGNMPKIEVHSEYSALMNSKAEKEIVSYLSEKYQHVQWILKSLEQRKRTLINVMEVIVDKQREFFTEGPLYLKPLSLKEVAEILELHESTISRATRNKYVRTPYGLFEMKSFFSGALATTDDTAISTTRVKQLIKALVDEENKKKPLSDQKIVELLEHEHEIILSRRTVAKYREQLNIPSSSRRKSI
ncbi:RNA polymerase factor sigma-54 [Bacillus sp. 165]|uniref:RNA polymerase factor sigma-54 n=1 Tax=Bacillus sp. 165 TaxID=1529117 RepID=UPI001ADC00D3|nr:RNA polymerase factor sigma-54 [Bacillus sp. 165]MBO9129918.1 RNA polymerase factor sigma-54 [Bacillus sp. 165]